MNAVSPVAIGLPSGGLSLTDAARSVTWRCSKGVFCSEHTELEIPASIVEGVCCCCRAGTRHHA